MLKFPRGVSFVPKLDITLNGEGVMRVAVIGSRSLSVANLGKYLPPETTEIVSGGAKGVDLSARRWTFPSGY